MIIDQLPALASPQDTDEIPIERGQLTYKIPWSNLAGGDIAALKSDMTAAQAAIDDLETDMTTAQAALDNLCLKATSVVTVSGNGTTTHTLTGLTADHEISNWGMFTDAACTTPIPSNNPTCDVTITPGADSWTMVIENFSATFYIRPTFILPQN